MSHQIIVCISELSDFPLDYIHCLLRSEFLQSNCLPIIDPYSTSRTYTGFSLVTPRLDRNITNQRNSRNKFAVYIPFYWKFLLSQFHNTFFFKIVPSRCNNLLINL